jgi:Holliday junction resolvasome RuvABC endonuclease subunit
MSNSSNNIPMYIGLDYSMTSPGIAVLHGDRIDLYGFYGERGLSSPNNGKQFKLDDGRILSVHVLKNDSKFKLPIERFDLLARKVLAVINNYDLKDTKPVVYIEGYSMASKGQVFHIAENTAILKHYLFRVDMSPTEIAPMTLKKFASGSGRAQKEDMHDAFRNETGVDLKELLTPNRKLGSPVTDLVDAFYIAKYAKAQHEERTKNEKRRESGTTQKATGVEEEWLEDSSLDSE